MKHFTQKELINESFWNNFKKPFKAVGGALGGLVRGGARALDYVAPEITQPLHRFEAGVRDVARYARKGADVGYGGIYKEYKDILLDSGYVMDETIKVVPSGRNHVVVGYRIIGKDENNKPIPDKSRTLSFLFDKDANFKIINTSAQDTSRMNRSKPMKLK